jgi:S-adenosylmethionine hydrolase
VGRTIQGEIVTVDRFGNLITNIPSHWLTNPSSTVTIADRLVGPLRRTYMDDANGSLIALISSSGHLEIAVVGGSAATTLKCAVGTCVTVEQ